MPRKVAFVMAVEEYQDAKISRVKYAEADATGFAAALGAHGFSADTQLLLSADATKAAIESKLRRVLRSLRKGDEFVLFYAGHGFSSNDVNYITSWDTQRGDLVSTSVPLQEVFGWMRESQGTQMLMFLDSCSSGLPQSSSARDVLTAMNAAEMADFFDAAEYCACFAACKADESSHSHGSLQHGIWSHHVIRALSGDATDAVDRGFVTSRSLQDYLARTVPHDARTLIHGSPLQTPWYFGGQSREYRVVDLRKLLEAKAQAAALTPVQSIMHQVALVGDRMTPVRSLSGFVKGRHRVPNDVNSATEKFVDGIAQTEIEDDLKEVHGALRDEFRYKRKDVDSTTADGVGTLITPDFDYTVRVDLAPDDPSTAVIHREVGNIRNPSAVESTAFTSVFKNTFTGLEFRLSQPLNVKEAIDRLEELNRKDMSLDYDHGSSHCGITLANADYSVMITNSTIAISAPGRPLVGHLVDAFGAVRDQFILDAVVPKALLESDED